MAHLHITKVLYCVSHIISILTAEESKITLLCKWSRLYRRRISKTNLWNSTTFN